MILFAVVLVLLLFAIMLLQFQSANAQLVSVSTLIGDIPNVRLGHALLWVLFAGFVSGLLIGAVAWQYKSIENRLLKRKLNVLKKQQLDALQRNDDSESAVMT